MTYFLFELLQSKHLDIDGVTFLFNMVLSCSCHIYNWSLDVKQHKSRFQDHAKKCRSLVVLSIANQGPGGSMSQVVGLPSNSYKPITNSAWAHARLCKLQKGCTGLASASDKVYQLLAHGRWFSPGTPASSTTKTDRHDIVEILLKVALKHQKSNQNHIL